MANIETQLNASRLLELYRTEKENAIQLGEWCEITFEELDLFDGTKYQVVAKEKLTGNKLNGRIFKR